MRITEPKALRSLYEGARSIPHIYVQACGLRPEDVEAAAEIAMTASALHNRSTASEIFGSRGNLREDYEEFLRIVEAAFCAMLKSLGEGKTRVSPRATLMGAAMAEVTAARSSGVKDFDIPPVDFAIWKAISGAEEQLAKGEKKVEQKLVELLKDNPPESVDSITEGFPADLPRALTLLGRAVVKAAMNEAEDYIEESTLKQTEGVGVALNLTNLVGQASSLIYFIAKRRKDAGATLPPEWESLADPDTVFSAVSPFVVRGAQEAAGPMLKTAIEDENGEVREVTPEEIQRAFLNDVRGRES